MFLFYLVIIVLILYLMLNIYIDYKLSKAYKSAIICPGVVIQSLDIERRDDYGGTVTVKKKISVEKYLVNYRFNNQIFKGEVKTVKTGLLPGSPIEVRISIDNGKHLIHSDFYKYRFKKILICTVLGVIYSAVLIYLIENGYI
ncbi:MAG: hypothetical protein K6G87_05220 [Butyrivibrio sp.]|uniref:hypothetical protein n=1 Tax=Butyrivibrio sp. TaxID=28121 RepID=UPI0025FC5B4A|nr:hypothetical protein [Butyrivibrio sp.]MCR5770621.1 hypothetical protein [Butyrivibrio sp.]